MKSRYSRRSILCAGGVAANIALAGCANISMLGQKQKPTEGVPIIIENQDSNSHDIAIEVFSAGENHNKNITVSVKSGERRTIDHIDGAFCIRSFIPALKNSKDVICPSPNEKDYSKDGFEIIVHSEKDREKSQSILDIHPINKE